MREVKRSKGIRLSTDVCLTKSQQLPHLLSRWDFLLKSIFIISHFFGFHFEYNKISEQFCMNYLALDVSNCL